MGKERYGSPGRQSLSFVNAKDLYWRYSIRPEGREIGIMLPKANVLRDTEIDFCSGESR